MPGILVENLTISVAMRSISAVRLRPRRPSCAHSMRNEYGRHSKRSELNSFNSTSTGKFQAYRSFARVVIRYILGVAISGWRVDG